MVCTELGEHQRDECKVVVSCNSSPQPSLSAMIIFERQACDSFPMYNYTCVDHPRNTIPVRSGPPPPGAGARGPGIWVYFCIEK